MNTQWKKKDGGKEIITGTSSRGDAGDVFEVFGLGGDSKHPNYF
jgi:hypothetical protein